MPHLPSFEEYSAEKVGQDAPSKDVCDQYDKDYGTYKNAVPEVPVDDRLPTANMPKAPDPSPFTLGPLGR